MEVIPFTLALSLLLSLTFIALFVREFSRPRRAGAEHDSLLPLEADLVPGACAGPAAPAALPARAGGDICSGGRPDAPRCSACRRRREREEQRAAVRAAASASGAVPVSEPCA